MEAISLIKHSKGAMGLRFFGLGPYLIPTNGLDKLQKFDNIEIYGNASKRIGVISFNIKNIHPHDLAQFLNEYNIALRVGHHCAQPLLSRLNETSTARLSTYIYNDEQDIDKLCSALQEIIGYFK